MDDSKEKTDRAGQDGPDTNDSKEQTKDEAVEKKDGENKEGGRNDREKKEEEERDTLEGIQAYDPEQYRKRKRENKENKENAEYHNCIFLDGKDLSNFVFNSGEINGIISQTTGGVCPDSSKIVFRKKEDLKPFLETYSIDDYASVFLVVLILKIVPVACLYPMARELKEHVKGFDVDSEKEPEKKADTLLALEDVLYILGAKKVTATVKSEAGEMKVQCITLQEYDLMSETAAIVWENYPGIRESLIQWLLSISKVREYRQMILYQITEALADLAAVDFAYTKNHIISRFVRDTGQDSFYFLKAILQNCLKSQVYRQNAETLLCHWCKLDNNDFLWKVALALVDFENDYRFCDSVRERLAFMVEGELKEGIALEAESVIYIFKEESKIPFQILQENRAASTMYLEILAEQFHACGRVREELRFACYFGMLMWQDYMAEGYPSYRSLFIDSVNQKEIREKMGVLLCSIWKRQTFRTMWMEPVLGMYIKEYDDQHKSWFYMKRFLRLLAFTGREADYHYMQKMLKRIGRYYGDVIPKEMQGYLSELLNKRKKG